MSHPKATGSPSRDGADLLQQVRKLLDEGQTEQARKVASAAARRLPENPQVHVALGEVAKKEGNWEEGFKHFERAAARGPNVWVCANLAECCIQTGRLERALECYGVWSGLMPADARPLVGMANALHGLGRFAEARQRLDAADRLSPSNARAHARRGCIHAALDEFDDAEREFSTAASLDASLGLCRLISFREELFNELTAAPELPVPQVLFQGGALERSSLVVLTSCDGVYFRKYGPLFLASFAQNSALGTLLHLHLYDADGELQDFVKSSLTRSGIARYVVSNSGTAVIGDAPHLRRVIYSCGRFLYLPAWMAVYQKPILALDIDAVLEGPAERLASVAAANDVALLGRAPPDSPWLDVLAGVLVALPNVRGVEYFRLVRSYILHFLRLGHACWHIDQIALYCGLSMLRRFGNPPSVAWLPPETLDGGALWHLGHAYDYKLEDRRLARYKAGARVDRRASRLGSLFVRAWERLLGK